MIRYLELKKKPTVFRSFTGLTPKVFETLLGAFTQAYEDDLDDRDAKRKEKRRRERGGGKRG